MTRSSLDGYTEDTLIPSAFLDTVAILAGAPDLGTDA